MTDNKYNWPEAKEYNDAAEQFASSDHRVAEAARAALESLNSDEADTLRLAEAIGKSHLKEEDPELWRQADDLSPEQRLAVFKLAVEYLEAGDGHAAAIRRAMREIAHH